MQIEWSSQHGLAHLLPPGDLSVRVFADQLWDYLIRLDNDLPVIEPPWLDEPALSRITVSSPLLRRPFAAYNKGRSWVDQVKPFNFMLVAHIAPYGYPSGVDPARFRLVAPYSADRGQWLRLPWRNFYDPDSQVYRLSTAPHDATMGPRPCDLVDVLTYRFLANRYQAHPEAKYADADGEPCGSRTRGPLYRRSVRPSRISVIGKETNELEQVNAGLHGSVDDIQAVYVAEDIELKEALAAVAHLSGRQLSRLLGLDRRSVDRIRRGTTPRPQVRVKLLETADAVSSGRDEHESLRT